MDSYLAFLRRTQRADHSTTRENHASEGDPEQGEDRGLGDSSAYGANCDKVESSETGAGSRYADKTR